MPARRLNAFASVPQKKFSTSWIPNQAPSVRIVIADKVQVGRQVKSHFLAKLSANPGQFGLPFRGDLFELLGVLVQQALRAG